MSVARRKAIVSVVTRNYASYAELLMASCLSSNPEIDRFVLVCDTAPPEWLAKSKPFKLISPSDLKIDNWRRFVFQYTPFELSCALKPFAIQSLFDRGYEDVVYLDGDMQVYSPMTDIFDTLQTHSVILTPHLHRPLPNDGCRPNESAFLSAGTFNAGLIAVSATSDGRLFIDWWRAMMAKRCIHDTAGSLFVDQKWLDLVPSLFDNVKIYKNPGYNVGHWSLAQFPFETADISATNPAGVLVGGVPLAVFHFSGMAPNKPNAYLKYQNRRTLEDLPMLKRLATKYIDDLTRCDLQNVESWGCEFDTMASGQQVKPQWREAIRREHHSLKHVVDPFDDVNDPRLIERYQALETVALQWRRDWQLKNPRPPKQRWKNLRKLGEWLQAKTAIMTRRPLSK